MSPRGEARWSGVAASAFTKATILQPLCMCVVECIWSFAYMYVCASYVCKAYGDQKKVLAPLGLGLLMVVRHHVGPEN